MRRRTAQVLATLADGTLPPPKREIVLRRVRRSAKLSRALHHQSFAIERDAVWRGIVGKYGGW